MITSRTKTKYPKSVKSPLDAKVLKPGSNNAKLGWMVKKGKWKGKPIFSVTLEERTTCPTYCHHWDDCYGNNMPFAHRFEHGMVLETKIQSEILWLIEHKHTQGIVIRLHVLGDFYSEEYVTFWEEMLYMFPELCVFGYTGHLPTKPIGKAIKIMNLRYSDRCVIRHSQNEESTGIGDLFAASEEFSDNGFYCPEQVGKVEDCAGCALCWQSMKTVIFRSH